MESNWTVCKRETLVVSATEPIVDRKHSRPLLLHRRGHRVTKEIPRRFWCQREPFLEEEAESGCNFGDQCLFRHTQADGQPSTKSKESGGKGSVALLKESIQLGCVSQDCPPRKSTLREVGKMGSNHTVRFSKGSWNQVKHRESKGPSQGVMPKCEPQDRNPCAPKFEDRTRQETLQQERCARREAWDLAKKCL